MHFGEIEIPFQTKGWMNGQMDIAKSRVTLAQGDFLDKKETKRGPNLG